MAFLQSLLSQHTVLVVVAIFSLLSAVLTAIGAALQAIGDQVPGWLGTAISWIGTAIHFINGVFPTTAAAPAANVAPK